MSTQSSAVAASEPATSVSTVNALFHVTGEAHPGLLSRLIEPVAKLGAVPTRVHASREAGDGSEMTVDLRLSDVSPRTAELVAMALRAIVGVSHVMSVVESRH